MKEHLEPAELEQFVLGTLDDTRLAQFEAHVSRCAACAASLTREARLELALVELAPRPVGPPIALRGVRARRVVPAILVAAAAVALLVVRRPGAPPREAGRRSIPDVICAAGPDQAACVQRAHRHGLYVQYPGWAGAPPLGDRALDIASGLVLRSAVGPSLPPFPLVAKVDL